MMDSLHPTVAKAEHAAVTACMCGDTASGPVWAAVMWALACLEAEIREDVR